MNSNKYKNKTSKEYQHEYYLKNKEKKYAYHEKYYQENIHYLNMYQRNYYLKNKERIKEYYQKVYANNRSYYRQNYQYEKYHDCKYCKQGIEIVKDNFIISINNM